MHRPVALLKMLYATAIFVALSEPQEATAFREGWERAPLRTYVPAELTLIPADEGDWFVSDTVSEFPECGSTPHRAEIVTVGGSRVLRLTSNDSQSDCADNVWVELSAIGSYNAGFSIPLTSNTGISFQEIGTLINPGRSRTNACIAPPCGDTIALLLADNRGNVLAYLLQRAPDAEPNERHTSYREVFLDPNARTYTRNLFEDFKTIPAFNPSGARIVAMVFEVNAHGSATLDNLVSAEGITPPPSQAGDLNGDGSLTPADALLAFQTFLGTTTLTASQRTLADVTKEGSITPADALCIFQKFLGLVSCLG